MNELAKRGHTGIGVDVEEMDITDAKKVNEVGPRASEVEAVIHCDVYRRGCCGRSGGALP